ncbi:MAG: energy-coupled thiamine transporter ThiT [Clostridia bacterium]|nr:energy-coupled thiamine transporter ThiT [Clostridia bacterium]
MKSTVRTKKMVESALLVAFATVLSLFHIVEMPYGGSVTVASMLPIVLIAYRHGLGWGLGSGVAYAVLQQLLGLKNLSYFTTWQSILAVILLDYIVAFAAVGLGGVFRRVIKKQNTALACGSLLVCVLRYICHVIAGATVWAGLSIPTEAALVYSLGYNATYMIPETVVLVLAAYYIGSLLDFRREQPARLISEQGAEGAGLLSVLTGLLAVVTVSVDASLIFSAMQDPESGAFAPSLLFAEPFVEGCWLGVTIVTAVAAVLGTALLVWRRRMVAAADKAEKE